MQWYYVKDNEQVGPVTQEDLARLAHSGGISQETLVWHEGLENWVPYSDAGIGAPTAPPPNKLKLASDSDVSAASGAHPIEEGESGDGEEAVAFMAYGGFWIRFVAKFIDGIILGGIGFGISMAAVPAIMGMMQSGDASTMQLVNFALQGAILLIQVLYTVIFLGKWGATPGKMICRLRVVLADGSPIGYGRAFGRFFAEIVSAIIIYIGYIIAAFDSEKRSLHDRICGTRVVKR